MRETYIPPYLHFKKFKIMESDMDQKIYIRTFSGRMTKRRWKRLRSFCRRMYWRQNCGHEWDCCGCMYSQSMSFSYKHNQVTILLYNHYNY